MRRFPVFLLPLFRPRKAYFLPNSLAAAGVAKVLVFGFASLSLFGGSSRASQPVLYPLCVGSSPALACPAGASACLPVRALAPMHMGLTPTRMLAAAALISHKFAVAPHDTTRQHPRFTPAAELPDDV